MHGTTRFNALVVPLRGRALSAIGANTNGPTVRIGGVKWGAWGVVGGSFKVIPTAIEIPMRHHEAMEWVFWERQRRCSQTADRLMYKDCSASERHLRPRTAGLLIPASQVRIVPGTPSKFETTASDCGLFIS